MYPDPSTVLPQGAEPTIASAKNPASIFGLSNLPTTLNAQQVQDFQKMTIPSQAPTDLTEQIMGFNQGVQQLDAERNTKEQGIEQGNKYLATLFNEITGIPQFQAQEEEKARLPALQNELLELEDLQRQQTLSYLQGFQNIQGKPIAMEFITGQQEQLNRQRAIDTMLTTALIESKQGRITKAQDTVKRAVDAKYDPIIRNYEMAKFFLEQQGSNLSRTDKKILEQKAEQQKFIEQQREEEKEIRSLGLKISANQAPQDVVSKIMNAKSMNDAIVMAAPYMQSPTDKIDLNYKIAQTMKIYNDIRNDNKLTTDPASALAYAQQYAATGQIPAGLPKGSFGAVAQYAKELPRPTGEIVSRATGVKPTGSDTQLGAMSALVSAVELAKQLQELDAQRWGGLVAGTAGKVFGSADQQRYVDTKKQIVDLLARARTGAAMTASEEKFYADMLPGRFSEPLGLGVDSSVKINNFIKNLSDDITNKSSAQGWSVYGYSTVKTDDGIERTVGSIIQAPDGRTGRVNADGSITLIQ